MTQTKNNEKPHCERTLTLRVDDCAEILGIGRSAAYRLVNEAASSNGKPFKVMRLGSTLLISKKSFHEYLESNGF